MTDLKAISADDFRPHDGTVFRLQAGDETLDATLVDVVARRGDTVHDAQRGPFSVLFRIDDERVLEQQIYHLEHDAMGALDLFLVPVGPDGKGPGICYEATFS